MTRWALTRWGCSFFSKRWLVGTWMVVGGLAMPSVSAAVPTPSSFPPASVRLRRPSLGSLAPTQASFMAYYGSQSLPFTPALGPSQLQGPRRAYQLAWEVELPLYSIASALAFARQFRTQTGSAPPYCVTRPEGCDKDDINPIDRPFAGRYEPGWSTYSDWMVGTLLAYPAVLLTFDGSLLNMVNDSVVVYQSVLVAIALSGLASTGASRPRPFVYGTEAPLSDRLSGEASLSYFSGHSSISFAAATSVFWTIQRREGSANAYSWLVLGGGSVAAASVATARVLAGKHFPTDVLAGSLVGISVGTLVPWMHDSPVQVVPVAGGQSGVSVTGIF